MPNKVTREDRKISRSRLDRSKKIVPPHKRKTDDVETNSASAKKINVKIARDIPEDLEKHYRVVNFMLVFSTIASLVKCVECDGKISFKSCKSEGLGFTIQVNCEKCKNPRYIPSSNRIQSGVYEINYRFAFAMRVLGLGLAGCEKFCGLMDLSTHFLSKSVYSSYIQKMYLVIKNVASAFFSSAVKEEREATCREKNMEDTSELTVSGDGTWKKRGFASLYGVSSLIGYYTGKVLDIYVKSSYCHDCKTWENKLDSAEYQEWYTAHVEGGKCHANHTGPSGNMEVDAIKLMFQRSNNNQVKYRNYIGDGDSKTYSGVVKSKPYGDDFLINKKECIGHVQKRMGTRLRNLVNKTTEESTTAAGKKVMRKSLSGKGKLTAKMIDKLTVYYGLAIRRNCNSVEKMKNAIWATFYHYSSTDKNPQHQKCDSGEDSWCEWQRAAATNNLKSFKHSYTALPSDVLQAIKPIYEDLSNDTLLERCLGGFTQNNNESLNQLIWKITPKILSGTSNLVDIAAHIAACTFNEGCFALLAIMNDMGITTGPSSHGWAKEVDKNRINRAELQAAIQSKQGRISRRQEQHVLDTQGDSSVMYGPGIDDSM